MNLHADASFADLPARSTEKLSRPRSAAASVHSDSEGSARLDAGKNFADRVEHRRTELEEALLARAYGIGNPAEVEDSEYLEGFRAAVVAAVDFAIATLRSNPGAEPAIPHIFFSQARLAARHNVGLDVVLRRYAAAHLVLVAFLLEEDEGGEKLSAPEVKALLASSSAAFDRLVISISDEHARETARCTADPYERTRVERVERMLAGELLSSELLDYPLEGWHIGLVVEGSGGRETLRSLAGELDRRLLTVEPRVGTFWAWLGGRSQVSTAEVTRGFRRRSLEMKVAIGEPDVGLEGWRLSHRQALAVLPLAEGRPVALARYDEKGLLASIQSDRLLVESLRKRYLDPLSNEKEGGSALRKTVGAYLAAECSTSSAASALRVHRQTVSSRLRAVEDRIGKPISECALELSLALMLKP